MTHTIGNLPFHVQEKRQGKDDGPKQTVPCRRQYNVNQANSTPSTQENFDCDLALCCPWRI